MEDGLDVSKSKISPVKQGMAGGDVTMLEHSTVIESEDTKAATDRKPLNPGKKLVKVRKTRYTTVDGYMQAEDYSSFDE